MCPLYCFHWGFYLYIFSEIAATFLISKRVDGSLFAMGHSASFFQFVRCTNVEELIFKILVLFLHVDPPKRSNTVLIPVKKLVCIVVFMKKLNLAQITCTREVSHLDSNITLLTGKTKQPEIMLKILSRKIKN